MINKLIKETLDSIGVESFYLKTTTKIDNYCVFSVYSEKDTDIFDDISNSSTYYVTINYWYNKKSKIFLEKYKEIKKVMKNNGFTFDSSTDIKSETHFGKNMDFIIKIWED